MNTYAKIGLALAGLVLLFKIGVFKALWWVVATVLGIVLSILGFIFGAILSAVIGVAIMGALGYGGFWAYRNGYISNNKTQTLSHDHVFDFYNNTRQHSKVIDHEN